MNIRALPAAAALLAALPLAVLAWEFHWRFTHDLLKPPAASPDLAVVAEVRALPRGDPVLQGTGVYLRGRWAYLRSLRPQLVAAGECDALETRWFGPRRLVIECELRAGEPQLLQPLVGDVAIELVVQRRFAMLGSR